MNLRPERLTPIRPLPWSVEDPAPAVGAGVQGSSEVLGSTESRLPYPRKKPEADPRRVLTVPWHPLLHHLLLVQDATR